MGFWRKGIACILAVACLLSVALQAQALTGLNASCPAYNFTSTDGQPVTNTSAAGKTKLIVFLRAETDLAASNVAIDNLSKSAWINDPGLSVIVADCDNNSADTVRAFAQSHQNGNITFCSGGAAYMWDFLAALGNANATVYLPAAFVVDAAGKIRAYALGENTQTAFTNLLTGFVDSIVPAKTTTLSFTGVNGYKEAFAVLDLLNTQRQKNGLPALRMDKTLLDVAMQRAAEVSVYYSHTRPNGTDCFTLFPSGPFAKGENVAIGATSAEEVMTGWMNSPGHRANILRSEYVSVGVGVFFHNGVYTWAQVFSSQSSTGITSIPENTTVSARMEVLEEHVSPKVSPQKLTLHRGETDGVSVYMANPEFPNHKVIPNSTDLVYRTDSPAVVRVDSKGMVTGIAPGTANVTVGVAGTNKSTTFVVTVENHIYLKTVEKVPTCGETGVMRYDCRFCQDAKTEVIAKSTNHTWDGGAVTKAPTVQSQGIRTYTCTVCGGTKTASIPKLSPTETTPTTPVVVPTAPPVSAPTVAPTAAPTQTPTAAPTQAPTKAPTVAPTVPTTAAPIQPMTQQGTAPAEPTAAPTQPAPTTEQTAPGEMPTQAETQPTDLPATVPATQTPTQPVKTQPENSNTKIILGVAVAVAAVIAGGVFLFYWKKRA